MLTSLDQCVKHGGILSVVLYENLYIATLKVPSGNRYIYKGANTYGALDGLDFLVLDRLTKLGGGLNKLSMALL